MFTNSYRELLFNKRWLEKKAKILQRDGYKCTICGSTNHLVVHHKQYHINKRTNQKLPPWEYDDKYLVTLCEDCHKRGHEKFQVPIKYITRL